MFKSKTNLTQILLLITLTAVFFTSPQLEAKVFRNSYVSFELPSNWNCYLENTAWICRYAISKQCLGKNSNSKSCKAQRKKTKEAIIILAAKEVGPKDSFRAYYDYLKKPRPIIMTGNKRSNSKVIHVKPISIEKHKWVDGMHLGSEIPFYYTRYLTTLKGNIAVLVTFSAHKLFYTKYSNDFFRAIKSLRVIATKASTVNRRAMGQKNVGILGGNIGAHLNTALDDVTEDGFDSEEPKGLAGNLYLILGAGLLGLLGLFVWFRGR